MSLVYYYSWKSEDILAASVKITSISHSKYKIEFEQTGFDSSILSDVVSIYTVVNRYVFDSIDSENLITRTITCIVKVIDNPSPEKIFDFVHYA